MLTIFASGRYKNSSDAYNKTGSYSNPMCYHLVASMGLDFGSHDIPTGFVVRGWCGVEQVEGSIDFNNPTYFPICAECDKLATEYEAKLAEFKERI